MFHRLLRSLALGCASVCTAASAATVDVAVTDMSGRAAASAVVSLTRDGAADASHVPGRAVIDQQHETFLPLVVVVRKGGEVVFTNNDTTMHQVYSFSPIKQFQFEIDRGQVSGPVTFDRPGTAAIGCNIHDNMVAYVFVADAPYAAASDNAGHVSFRDVPEGNWHVNVWHPALRVGRQPPPVALAVAGQSVMLKVQIPLSAAPAMSRMHKDY